jgi:TRAP-type transport system periplasmic protein
MKFRSRLIHTAAAAVLAATLSPAHAQEVTLKVHFFLPATSFANTLFIQPWCDKIAKESNNRMKCQSYP